MELLGTDNYDQAKRGHGAVTPDMALRLSRAFDTTPEMWLNLQKNYDLWHAAHD
ncbi:MAG: addiction module antidote protein, HigA family [Desulfobulbaceae bacterium]|nr:MAG: addiction module antidote protein, HigA family [Desulfobulbaceae bacterium]